MGAGHGDTGLAPGYILSGVLTAQADGSACRHGEQRIVEKPV